MRPNYVQKMIGRLVKEGNAKNYTTVHLHQAFAPYGCLDKTSTAPVDLHEVVTDLHRPPKFSADTLPGDRVRALFSIASVIST